MVYGYIRVSSDKQTVETNALKSTISAKNRIWKLMTG